LCWKVSKRVVKTNRIEALNRNGKTLKEKRSFRRVIRNEGKLLTQRTKRIRTDLTYGTKGLKSKRKKMVIGRNFGVLGFSPLGCCFSC